MKKLLALLLSLVMLLGLMAGCAREDDDEDDDDYEKTSSLSETKKQEEDEETETTAATEQEEEQATAPAGYVRGTNTANGWMSDFMGLQFMPASGMTMATDADLEAMMNISSEVMKDNGYGELIVDYTMLNVVYEMMATDTSGNNVLVNVEKMVLSSMTEEDYAEVVGTQLSAAGYTIGDPYEVTLWGKDFLAVDTSVTMNNIAMTQCYLLLKIEDRMCCVIFTDVTGDSLETFLGCFSEY